MLSSISITQLLIVLIIVICIFGTKRFRQAGGDLGAMVRGIREGFGAKDTDELLDQVEETTSQVRHVTTRVKEMGNAGSEANKWDQSGDRY